MSEAVIRSYVATKLCPDCQHWQRPEKQRGGVSWGRCDLIKDYLLELTPESIQNGLSTPEYFGCVRWEKR
jgi:hypothetical protein